MTTEEPTKTETENTHNLVVVPADKYLDPVKSILSDNGVVIRGTRVNPPTIAVGVVPGAVRGALKAVGCEVKEGELFQFTEIEFSEKIEHSLALTLAAMAPRYRDQRILNAIVRTTLPKGKATEMLAEYDYEPYPGFASTFIMQLSANEVETLLGEDWTITVRLPVAFDMNSAAWDK